MPSLPRALPSLSILTDTLKTIIEVKQTGYLKLKEGDKEGCLAVENGVLLHAKAGTSTGFRRFSSLSVGGRRSSSFRNAR